VPQVLGESFRRETIRHQIGNRTSGPITDQNVLTVLFVDASCQSRFGLFRFLLLLLLRPLNVTGLFASDGSGYYGKPA
jgi:hypothetical protein